MLAAKYLAHLQGKRVRIGDPFQQFNHAAFSKSVTDPILRFEDRRRDPPGSGRRLGRPAALRASARVHTGQHHGTAFSRELRQNVELIAFRPVEHYQQIKRRQAPARQSHRRDHDEREIVPNQEIHHFKRPRRFGRDDSDVRDCLNSMDERSIRQIGDAAQARVLGAHTNRHRAIEFENAITSASRIARPARAPVETPGLIRASL